MGAVAEFFSQLFSTAGFPPRWYCGRWTDFHGWTYIIGDLLIWSAYFAIPLIILMYVSKRRSEIRFQRIYLLFASFILACGSTHLIDALIFWQPVYRFSALIRVVTGIISWTTVYFLVKTLPTAFALKSPQALEKEVVHRRAVEEELLHKNAMLAAAQSIARLGNWSFDVASGAIVWSDEMYRIWGMPVGSKLDYEKYLGAIHPSERSYVNEQVGSALSSGVFSDFHHRIVVADTGEIRHIQSRGEAVLDEHGKVIGLRGTAQDVTKQRLAELQIIAKSRQLEKINAELENFAYIASHDLQEPLRKVITFSSMLREEAGGKIDGEERLYLDKITSAAGRMQRLIQDILQFSRLAQPEDFKQVALSETIQHILADAELRIKETGASVEVGPLAVIEAVPSQMEQLFSNLVGNALKYIRADAAPQLRIWSEEITGAGLTPKEQDRLRYHNMTLSPAEWAATSFCRVHIADNGIGFEPEYAEKIFTIFQRLHGRNAYEGTGIGLAVCRKIADNHHGAIEAFSRPGEGATFTVTLPVSQDPFTHRAAVTADAGLAEGVSA